MRMETRPRRRLFDGVDAGYRIFSVLFNFGVWLLVTALVLTNPIRESWWLIPCAALGVILIGKLVFAGWAVTAWWRERAWMRAQHEAEQVEHPTRPYRDADVDPVLVPLRVGAPRWRWPWRRRR